MEYFLNGLKRTILILILAIIGLIYLISPIDLIPDFIPIIGWLDDLGIVGAIISYFIRKITVSIAFWVIILPVIVGGCLGLIFPPLGVIAGIGTMIYGFWRVGKYFDDDD